MRVKRISVLLLIFVNFALGQDVGKVGLYVSVMDKDLKHVSGIDKSRFQVFVDGKPQEIINFSIDHEPATIGFVIEHYKKNTKDVMTTNAPILFSQGLEKFMPVSENDNEYFVSIFSDKYRIVSDFSPDLQRTKDIIRESLSEPRGGYSKYYDCLSEAIEKVKLGKHRKKVLILLGSGVDRYSKRNEQNIVELLKANNIQLYQILVGWDDHNNSRPLSGYPGERFFSVSGGRKFEVLRQIPYGKNFLETEKNIDTPPPQEIYDQTGQAFEMLSQELNTHYLIEFKFSDTNKPEKYRQVKIVVKPATGTVGSKQSSITKLTAYTRSGFYPSMTN